MTSLVYSHTHIVRLRVTRGGTVLADVGGPYIIAPVSGLLRVHGRTVARYVLSVQDDLGYVKLETRYIGFPLLLRRGAQRIPGRRRDPLRLAGDSRTAARSTSAAGTIRRCRSPAGHFPAAR